MKALSSIAASSVTFFLNFISPLSASAALVVTRDAFNTSGYLWMGAYYGAAQGSTVSGAGGRPIDITGDGRPDANFGFSQASYLGIIPYDPPSLSWGTCAYAYQNQYGLYFQADNVEMANASVGAPVSVGSVVDSSLAFYSYVRQKMGLFTVDSAGESNCVRPQFSLPPPYPWTGIGELVAFRLTAPGGGWNYGWINTANGIIAYETQPNVSLIIGVIPEPSSATLGLVATLLAFYRRRSGAGLR